MKVVYINLSAFEASLLRLRLRMYRFCAGQHKRLLSPPLSLLQREDSFKKLALLQYLPLFSLLLLLLLRCCCEKSN
jgi:hypothetical protein